MARAHPFRIFDNVYDEATIAKLRSIYERVVSELPPDAKTRADLSVVERQGRLDVLLTEESVRVSEPVLAFVKETMHASVMLRPWVRTFVVAGPRPEQPWHRDFVELVATSRPLLATLIVALDDVTEAMGGTEFCARRIPEDGILQPEDLDESAVLRVLLKRNQGLLFDGRILHRGAATRCARAPVMYHLFERNI
jgi:hypothetical protein